MVVDSGALHGLPVDVPARAGRAPASSSRRRSSASASALGNAIGAAIARPDRLTVAALGDGGALMALPELETLGRLRPADARRHLRRRRLRRRGPPLRARWATPSTSRSSPTPTSRRSARAAGCHGLTARSRRRPRRRCATWLAAPRPARSCSTPRSIPTICGDWLEEAFRGTDRRRTTHARPLADLVDALRRGAVAVVDLTQPLSERTPVLAAARAVRQHARAAAAASSAATTTAARRGRGTSLEIGEHVGTHFDAPIHWITGRDGEDVASVPPARLVGPAVVIDKSAEAARGPRLPAHASTHVQRLRGRARRRSPRAAGCCCAPAGTRAPTTRTRSSTPATASRTRRASTPSARAGWRRRRPIVGVGVETVGTDAGAAGGFDPPFPVHNFLLGAGKYGLTQLANLAELPPTGARDRRRAAEARRRHRQPDARAGAGRRLS